MYLAVPWSELLPRVPQWRMEQGMGGPRPSFLIMKNLLHFLIFAPLLLKIPFSVEICPILFKHFIFLNNKNFPAKVIPKIESLSFRQVYNPKISTMTFVAYSNINYFMVDGRGINLTIWSLSSSNAAFFICL